MTAILQGLGWYVVHSLWQCTLLAGAAAFALGCARSSSASLRARLALFFLGLMAAAPVISVAVSLDIFGETERRSVLMTIDRVIDMPTYLKWRTTAVSVLGGLWIAGISTGLLRFAVAWRRASALRRTATISAGERAATEVSALRTAMDIAVAVDVRRSAEAAGPMVLGILRPLILLPPSTDRLSSAELRAVLAHELAHVIRRDYAINALQVVIDCALFFHPAARWLSREIRKEREFACDDAAVRVSGSRALYAHALASLEDSRISCPLIVAAASGTLVDRIARIAGKPRRTITAASGAAWLIVAAVISAAVVAATAALPQSMPPDTQMRRRSPANAPPSTRDALPSLPRSSMPAR